jgi:hypothetical protein
MNKHYSKNKFLNYILDTPLYEWWKQKAIVFRSPYQVVHISVNFITFLFFFNKNHYHQNNLKDAARLALLYKYGGIYSDFDTITMKSFQSLLKYSGFGLITESNSSSVGNGLIIFKSNHPYLNYTIKQFVENYSPGGL